MLLTIIHNTKNASATTTTTTNNNNDNTNNNVRTTTTTATTTTTTTTIIQLLMIVIILSLGAIYCTPEINTSEIIVDFQRHFPMDFRCHFSVVLSKGLSLVQ